MKRLLIAVLCLVSVNAYAQSITCSQIGGDGTRQLLVGCVCVSDGNGAFTALTALSIPTNSTYYNDGYYLAHVYAINRSSGQPDTAGTVTITDSLGQQLVGSTVGDTLTLSTSASGGAYLSADRASSQRPVAKPLYFTIGDTQSGAATSTFDLYLLLRK